MQRKKTSDSGGQSNSGEHKVASDAHILHTRRSHPQAMLSLFLPLILPSVSAVSALSLSLCVTDRDSHVEDRLHTIYTYCLGATCQGRYDNGDFVYITFILLYF